MPTAANMRTVREASLGLQREHARICKHVWMRPRRMSTIPGAEVLSISLGVLLQVTTSDQMEKRKD